METERIDTNTLKGSIDLIELAGRYTTLHRESAREWAGPCPKCGGDDRFHVTVDRFMCRQCHPRWGDAIEFVRWVDGRDFREAVTKLGGSAAYEPTNLRRQPSNRPQIPQTSEWRDKATCVANTARERLLSSVGQSGADYLLGRGLEPHTWQRFGLGYRTNAPLPGTWDSNTKQYVHPPQPAIVIPWHDEAGDVKAIRYRFLQSHSYIDVNGRQRCEKQCAVAGSQFTGQLYGWPGLFGGCERWMTLVICEGELNDLSIWQAQHNAALDVLSLGSESQRLTPPLIAMARQYQQVIVWADRNDVAWQLKEAIPGAHGVKSPNGMDANDLLQTGKLSAHLAGMRFDVAATAHEREGVLWDLYDAATLFSGVDAGTWEAIKYIANLLGKQVLHKR